MQEVGTLWFTNFTGVVGIVWGTDVVTGEPKAYIGVGAGIQERLDAENIKRYGSPVDLASLEDIATFLRGKGVRQ